MDVIIGGEHVMLIMNTCPTKESAQTLARSLVEKKLAACVSVLPIECSVYKWKGKIEEEKEYLLLIKTKSKLYARVEMHIKANHPHEIPEVIAFKADKAERIYRMWVERNTQ